MARRNPKLVKFKPLIDISKQSAIKTLEEALRQAKAGDVISVGIAVVRPSGSINASRSDTHDVGRLLGAISLLHHRTLTDTERD